MQPAHWKTTSPCLHTNEQMLCPTDWQLFSTAQCFLRMRWTLDISWLKIWIFCYHMAHGFIWKVVPWCSMFIHISFPLFKFPCVCGLLLWGWPQPHQCSLSPAWNAIVEPLLCPLQRRLYVIDWKMLEQRTSVYKMLCLRFQNFTYTNPVLKHMERLFIENLFV